jgi:hypothetical protein
MSELRPWENIDTLHYEFPIQNREARFKQLVLYISERCIDDPTYSKIKLLKILHFSDFEAYGTYGEPITGMRYRKMPYGPVPVDYPRLQEEMVRERLVKVHFRRVYEHSSQRLLPLQKPNFDFLRAQHIAIVDGWITKFWNETAKRVSEFSHGRAWKLAKDGEPIPYEAVFISNEPATFEDVDRVKDLATKFGWQT